MVTEQNKSKRSEYNKKYYQSNKERAVAYSKKYYQEHKKQILKARKKYRKEHPEKYYSYQKKYWLKKDEAANGGEFAATYKCGSAREYHHNYYINNKEKFRQYREKKKEIPIPEEKRLANKEYQKAYRNSHKETAQVYGKKYYQETKNLNEIAENTCPAFLFLLAVRKKDSLEYLKFYRPGQNIARIGRKLCDAANAGDSSKCPFCNNGVAKDAKCPIPHVFEFANAKEKLLQFGNEIKNKSK